MKVVRNTDKIGQTKIGQNGECCPKMVVVLAVPVPVVLVLAVVLGRGKGEGEGTWRRNPLNV